MDIPLETIFRDNLRFYRQKSKLSQERLSALLDKNINYINMIESGKSLPPITVIEQIAKILEVEPKCFLDSLENNEKNFFDRKAFISDVKREIAKSSEEILTRLFENKNF